MKNKGILVGIIAIIALLTGAIGAYAESYLNYTYLGRVSWSDDMVVKFKDGNVTCYSYKESVSSPSSSIGSASINGSAGVSVALSCVLTGAK